MSAKLPEVFAVSISGCEADIKLHENHQRNAERHGNDEHAQVHAGYVKAYKLALRRLKRKENKGGRR